MLTIVMEGNDMSELLPCPFCMCESGAVRVNTRKAKNAQGFIKYVYCGECHARGSKAHSDIDAIKAWNKGKHPDWWARINVDDSNG